jgi:urease accessory protein
MLNLTQRLPADFDAIVEFSLALTADERLRSRHYFKTSGQDFYLHLPRGTVLHHGDLLQAEADHQLVRILAKPEPVMTVTAQNPLDLLRAAYHLGNRHVPLEVTAAYLRFPSDSVLKNMLEQLGLEVVEDVAPFEPEMGAYGHSHTGGELGGNPKGDRLQHPPDQLAHHHAD